MNCTFCRTFPAIESFAGHLFCSTTCIEREISKRFEIPRLSDKNVGKLLSGGDMPKKKTAKKAKRAKKVTKKTKKKAKKTRK